DSPAGALLDPDALGDLADASLELFHLDAVLARKRIDHRLPVRRAELGMIDGQRSFLLGAGLNLGPILCARRREQRASGDQRNRQGRLSQRMHKNALPWALDPRRRRPVEFGTGIKLLATRAL